MKLEKTKISARLMMTSLTLTAVLQGCAQKPVQSSTTASSEANAPADISAISKVAAGGKNGPLICKARKSKFRFDWEATSPSAADGRIDQNSVSYEFRAADRPAGSQGENLKVGECGWAAAPMANSKKEKSSLSYKRLSDEATETFYKIRTGKVFSIPVRQGKSGVVAVPGAPVTVVR